VDALLKGYKTIDAEDAVEAFTQEEHEQRLKCLKHVYDAGMMRVDEIMKAFKQTLSVSVSKHKKRYVKR
jgi:hypothetical protein